MAEQSGNQDVMTRRPRNDATQKAPPAPGASVSPQRPGMVPDRSSVPGHFSTRVAPVAGSIRPLAQYGSAEEIMRVYHQKPDAEITKEDFESQADASYEELRKSNPALLAPERPQPRAIARGDEAQALPAEAETSGQG